MNSELIYLVDLTLPHNIVGVGAGEAGRLQTAPHLRLAARRPPVQEQLILLRTHNSSQAYLVAVKWKASGVKRKSIISYTCQT